MVLSFTIQTKNGISWHCERQGTGPHIVLIPSGEGDCGSFSEVARLLASSFTVTTFDMPGMSRTTAPTSCTKSVTGQLLASQIVVLLDALSIDAATFYGSSSAAIAALALAAYHPDRVRNIVIHEAPLIHFRSLKFLCALPDLALVPACQYVFGHVMNENHAAWKALGPEFHARLEKNYVLWAREYARSIPNLRLTDEEYRQRPITWTIGSLTPGNTFASNLEVGRRIGIKVELLYCKHFPQVSIPETLAEHIERAALKQ
ncbi:zearalenone hydrolase [Leptodontidium sp. MPI-SDFR-AT-0119]|nr:zearalenone hydrolase [Leptodontidium sp. MPI-SDFR-AT-0119]